MSKSKDEGKDKPEGPKNEKVKYKYIEQFSSKDQPLKETTSRVGCPRLWRITKNSLHNEGIYK